MRGEAARRPGFTLVELMVVIAIIGILAGFISAAAMSAIGKAREASIRGDIDALSIGVETYKQRYGAYPPNLQDLPAVKQHLYKLFPRCKDAIPAATSSSTTTFTQSLWRLSPGGTGAGASTTYALTGSSVPLETWERTAAIMALPFWLGGFYPDPEHPLSPPTDINGNYISNASRVAIFDFKPGRLRPTGVAYRPVSATTAPSSGTGQISKMGILYAYYPEGLDTPYVYFNSSRYDPRDLSPLAAYSYPAVNIDGTFEAGATAGSLKPVHLRYARVRVSPEDLSLLSSPIPGSGVPADITETVALPYRASANAYVNPNSFQIICAGMDNKYSGIQTTNFGYPMQAAANDGLIGSGGAPLTGVLTHDDLYTKYIPFGGLWYYPSGPVFPTASDKTALRGPGEHKDNLTNFTRGRLESDLP